MLAKRADQRDMVDDGAAVQKISNQVNEEMNKEQDLYDKETNHGINSTKQNEWIDSVHAQLKALSNFQGNEIIIK